MPMRYSVMKRRKESMISWEKRGSKGVQDNNKEELTFKIYSASSHSKEAGDKEASEWTLTLVARTEVALRVALRKYSRPLAPSSEEGVVALEAWAETRASEALGSSNNNSREDLRNLRQRISFLQMSPKSSKSRHPTPRTAHLTKYSLSSSTAERASNQNKLKHLRL